MRTNIVLNTVHCTPNADGHLFLLGVTANGDARALQRALLHLPPLAQLCLANTAHPHGTAEQEGTGRSQTFCTRELQCRPHTEESGASGGFGCRLPCASEGPLGRTPTAPEESHGKAERGLWVNTYIRVISPAHRAAVLHRVAQRRGLPPHPAADPRRRGSERQRSPRISQPPPAPSPPPSARRPPRPRIPRKERSARPRPPRPSPGERVTSSLPLGPSAAPPARPPPRDRRGAAPDPPPPPARPRARGAGPRSPGRRRRAPAPHPRRHPPAPRCWRARGPEGGLGGRAAASRRLRPRQGAGAEAPRRRGRADAHAQRGGGRGGRAAGQLLR